MRRTSQILKMSVAAIAVVASYSGIAHAQAVDEAEKNVEEVVLDTIVIEASRTDRAQDEIAQTVSVRTDEDIERLQATSVEEILDRIPGVRSSDGFYASPTVRGGNQGQVIVNVDGVDQTSSTNKGMAISPLSIDPMLIKQVEVLKGSSAALYGSGGIGGVIAIRTKEASDLLDEGQLLGGFISTRYDTRDRGLRGTVATYGRTSDDVLDFVITADGYNSELYKDNPSKHSERTARRFSGKVGWNIDDSQRLQVNAKYKNREHTNRVVAPDEIDDYSLQLRYNIERGDHINAKVNGSYNLIKRSGAFTAPAAGLQDSELQRIQFDAQNSHELSWGPTDHEITYGGSFLATKQEGKVNGTTDNFANANGDRREFGGYIQDVIDWEDFTLTTALRYVNYRMEGGNGDNDMSEQAFMPSVGLTYRATDWLNLYASYAHDFRAPSIDDMYTAQEPPGAWYAIVPNPGLKPERSINREIGFMLHKDGLTGENDRGMIRFSYFNQNVKNLMELGIMPPKPGDTRTHFTTLNVARANRSGMEVEARYQYDNFTMSVTGDRLRVLDRSTGRVEHHPWTLLSMFAYNMPEHGLDVAWYTDAVGGSEKNKTGDYVLHGVRARWQDPLNIKGLELSGGVRNIFDRQYRNQWGRQGEKRTFLVGATYKF